MFDKEISKEIEKSFGKVIKRYQEKSKSESELKKHKDETSKMKPIYKYSSCDYIPRVYFEGKNEEDKINDNEKIDQQ